MPQKRGDSYERAQRLGHKPIVENELVQEELEEFNTKETDPDDIPIKDESVSVSNLESDGNRPDFLLSIDGSPREVATNDEYPNNRIGFVQIAAVLTYLDKVQEQKSNRFVDPAKVEKIDESALQHAVLPSTNYTVGEADTVTESWRKKLYETFEKLEIEVNTLLDIYLEVIQPDDRAINDCTVKVSHCPNPDCDSVTPVRSHSEELGECDSCGITVYPTDALRTHENVRPNQQNQGALTNVMNVLEHLTMCGYLLYLSKNSPERLSRTGFVMDGPLAIFNRPAWLHRPILDTVSRIYDRQKEKGYSVPIIVGVEKSGNFYDHADNIDEEMEPGSVLGMSDEYIYNYVIEGNSNTEYGNDTYYGQKFIYKSESERIFVLSLPQIADGIEKHPPGNYPMMRRALETINEVETALYDDATIPITLAHQRASIPLKTGSRVLELFTKEKAESNDGPIK
jgi:hypothetical protein